MATATNSIEKQITALKNGELFKIKLPNTSVPMFVGVCNDGKSVLVGACITGENLANRNVDASRIYKNKKAAIAKLKAWNIL